MASTYNINISNSSYGITDTNWNNVTPTQAGTPESLVDTNSSAGGVSLTWLSGDFLLDISSDTIDHWGIPVFCWNTLGYRTVDGTTQFKITGLQPNSIYTVDIFIDLAAGVDWTVNGQTIQVAPSGGSEPPEPTRFDGTTSASGEILFTNLDSPSVRGINGVILNAISGTGGTGGGVGGFPIRESYSGEPITILTIDQDTCALSWSEGECQAGRYNVIPNNKQYDSVAHWDRNDWSSIDGGSTITEFTKLSPSLGNLIESVADIVYPPDVDIYYSFQAEDESGALNEIRLVVQTVAGFSDAVVNLSTGAFVNGSANDAFDTIAVTDGELSGWYRVEVKILAANVPETGSIAFEFLTSGGVPSIGDQGRIYGLQAALAENQDPPAFSTGTPIWPVSTKQCFNTRGTCQDPDNYDLDTLPLNFVKPRSSALRDGYYIPSLKGVSIGAAKLNPGGANKSASAFGQRAVISASFQDHPHNDFLVDKYRDQRSYDPLDQGSFWSKWRARNPYYMHRFVTLKTGFIDNGVFVPDIERSFVMTGFSGPDSAGNISIKGKDILTIAENVKSQAPAVSTGKLLASILAGDGSATLTPAGIGDLEYPASGSIRMEREVMTFTRIGDALTLTLRGTEGTNAADHDDGTSVQLCLVYAGQKPQDILYDLLLNYAGIPDVFLDKAGWDAEQIDFLPHLYTTIIAEPEGVAALISEMCQQMYFSVWWDERTNLVKMRAVRSAQDDLVYNLNDNASFIKDSVKWKDLSDQLITQVWVYFGQIDPTEKLDKASNYAVLEASIDLTVEDETKQGIKKVQKIYSRWIPSSDAGAAVALGGSILDRYANIPREVSFKVDAKDGAMWLGDFAQVTNRLQVDQFGVSQPTNIQIYQAEESVSGSVFSYVGQQFIGRIEGAEDGAEAEIIIGADLLNVDLRALYESQRGAPTTETNITFVIRNGVTIGGDTAGGGVNVELASRSSVNDVYDAGLSSNGGTVIGDVSILQRSGIVSVRTTLVDGVYAGGANTANWEIREYPLSIALTTGLWPVGATISLVVEAGGVIAGEGGNGCAHAFKELAYPAVSGILGLASVNSSDGGNALEILHPVSITNAGIIGGGGGGGGHIAIDSTLADIIYLTRGGGGAGLNLSSVTSNLYMTLSGNPTTLITEPSRGTVSSNGIGGSAFRSGGSGDVGLLERYFNSHPSDVLAKADGGGLGENGMNSTLRVFDGGAPEVPHTNIGLGGLAGEAITEGSSLITWVNKGDVRGAENV